MSEHGVRCLFWQEVTCTLDHLDGHPRRGLRPQHPVHRAVLPEEEQGVDTEVIGAVPTGRERRRFAGQERAVAR